MVPRAETPAVRPRLPNCAPCPLIQAAPALQARTLHQALEHSHSRLERLCEGTFEREGMPLDPVEACLPLLADDQDLESLVRVTERALDAWSELVEWCLSELSEVGETAERAIGLSTLESTR